MKRKQMLMGGVAVAVFLTGEVVLRMTLGMCNAPLYRASDKYEYMACPNQDGTRFGYRYHYNSYSQRSEEPDSTRKIILGLGDSVLFGGVVIDQDSIATSIFTRETDMQMLNISAGSWGPDNCAAYLQEEGLFGAEAMFLLVSSHDAHDNMDFLPVVGRHASYPGKQYVSAWSELICRYVYPRIIGKWLGNKQNADPDKTVLDGIGIRKGGKDFNPGFAKLKRMADENGIPLYVCLHADRAELNAGQYNEQGEEIIEWCRANGIEPILELQEGLASDMFRDGIHTNEKGQRFMARLMMKYIKF